jgi:hypothetical protein
MKRIKIINLKTGEITEGFIASKNDESHENITIELNIGNHKIFESTDKNLFRAISNLRKKIYPYELMIIATQKYVIYRKGAYYPPTKLGERRHPRELKPFYYGVDDNNFAQPNMQLAYMKLYEKSFKSYGDNGLLGEYGISKNHIIIEKMPKHRNILKRVSNENYQYFWIFDMHSYKIYNIENENDIRLFKQGKLMPTWHSLDAFIEYYADNWLDENMSKI